MQSIKEKIGSYTAKGGFQNEHDVTAKFNNWQNDVEAKQWLKLLGYESSKIKELIAVQIPASISQAKFIELGGTLDKLNETKRFKKADIQIQVKIVIDDVVYLENISLKKANANAAYNQVDKRPVSTYQCMWGFDDKVADILKRFTGEYPPPSTSSLKDPRRVNFTEFNDKELKQVVDFFEQNKHRVINDLFQGRGALKADWMLVTKKMADSENVQWVLKSIVDVCNHYSNGAIEVSPRGSMKIGRVTMQRKGGTPDPNSLQFKCNPLELFGI